MGDRDCVKNCPCCREKFSRTDLMQSPEIVPIGMLYYPAFEDAPAGTFYFFNHVPPDCRTTFTTPVEVFAEELGPMTAPQLFGTGDCEKQCSRLDDLEACDRDCANAPYRRFLIERLLRRR